MVCLKWLGNKITLIKIWATAQFFIAIKNKTLYYSNYERNY